MKAMPIPKQVIEKTFIIEKAVNNQSEPKRPLSIGDSPILTSPKPPSKEKESPKVQPEKKEKQKQESKAKKQVSISPIGPDPNHFDINKRVFKQVIPAICPIGENIGNLIVRQKNIMLAKEHNIEHGDNFHLLITKEVFIIERVPNRI